MLGYEFDYPPEARLITVGVTGYPTDELPSGVEPGEFTATLEATYTEALGVGKILAPLTCTWGHR
jgi:hypothetical protein